MIYFVLFGIFALLAVLDLFGKLGRWSLPLFWTMGVVMVLFSGLRWETGTDWESYFWYYEASHPKHPWDSYGYEYGFFLWNRLVAWFQAPYTLYLILTATMGTGLTWLALAKSGAPRLLGALILFANTLVVFSLTRQTLAGAFVLLAFVNLAQKKPWHFLVLVALAATFHISALVVLVALVLDRDIGWQVHMFALLFAFAFSVSGLTREIVILIKSFIPVSSITESIDYYLRIDNTSGLRFPPLRELLGPIKHFCLLFLIYWLFIRQGSPTYQRLYLNLYVFGLIIYLLTYRDLMVFQRFFWYFNPVQAVLLAKSLAHEKGGLRIVLLSGVGLYYIVLLWFTLSSYWTEYYPYRWVL